MLYEDDDVIWAICYSDKTGDSISFGKGFDSENETPESMDTSWIGEGLDESFWENYRDFEDGVNFAHTLCADNPQLSFAQALFTVFGHFKISFELNNQPYKLQVDFDVDTAMYELLKYVC